MGFGLLLPNADAPACHHQEAAFGKILRVIPQGGDEPIDLGLERRAGQAEQDEPGVGKRKAYYHLAKIQVGRDHDAALPLSDRQDLVIVQSSSKLKG